MSFPKLPVASVAPNSVVKISSRAFFWDSPTAMPPSVRKFWSAKAIAFLISAFCLPSSVGVSFWK